MTPDPSSADRLREKLAGAPGDALRLLQTEALYNLQMKWTCDLLDLVDTLTDPVTGALIADLIYEKLTGDGASEAAERQRGATAEYERLTAVAPPRFSPDHDETCCMNGVAPFAGPHPDCPGRR